MQVDLIDDATKVAVADVKLLPLVPYHFLRSWIGARAE